MPTDSATDPYPISGDEEPGQAYPIDESPDQPESSEASGGMAYITDPIASQDDLNDHAENINKFALELYRKLAQEEGNLIYSPYSIYQAFLMLYAGANTETKAEIAQVLELEMDDDQDIHNLMNALNKLLTTTP
jgi:serpin B